LVIPANGAPALDAVIDQMLTRLKARVPADPPPADPALPATSLRLLSVAERPTGLANRLGNETHGSLGPLSVKGGRLEAAVLFETWGANPAAADTAALTVHGALAGARDLLRGEGFLRVDGADFSLPEEDAVAGGWRKTAAYSVLYEYRYLDTESAASLIVKIPADADQEALGLSRETTVVTGRTVRWDDEESLLFSLRGPGGLSGLSVLAFIPGTVPAGPVVVRRTFDGAAGAEDVFADLASFLPAVSGAAPTSRHARIDYPTLTAFLNDLGAPADSVELGDWDVDTLPDTYPIHSHAFPQAIELPRFADRFEIVPPAAALSETAVLYLRAER
jgi:hypothetical protein